MTAAPETFPVLWQGSRVELRELAALSCPRSVTWSLIEPHARQAERNHGQTLRRLAERGGLCPSEMVAVLEDRPWRKMDNATAVARLRQLIESGPPCPGGTQGGAS